MPPAEGAPKSEPAAAAGAPLQGVPSITTAAGRTAAGDLVARGAAASPSRLSAEVSQPAALTPAVASVQSATPVARLVGVRRDGTDGNVYPMHGERFDVGRTAGDLRFPEDVYLSERHLRIERRGGGFVALDLSGVNGVFVRIRQKERLESGGYFLLGMQLLRFEALSEIERTLAPALEHGVRLFGTPMRAPWGRLRQVTTAGTSRDVFHLVRAEVVLGRESGDIVFSEDDFMSRMHASVRLEGSEVWLVDLNSSNGTYLRIAGARPLQDGDHLRIGDQLLRFETL